MHASPTRALAIVVGVVAVLASPGPAIAQHVPVDPLTVRMPDDATDANVELIVSIATRLGVPLGFEAVGALSERVSMPFKVQSSRDARKIVSVRPLPRDVRGLTLRQALDVAVASDRRYEWRDIGGVVVIRPTSAWRDPGHPLLRRATATQFDDAGLSTDLEAAPLFDLLNTAVRRHGGWQWSLRSEIGTIFLDRGQAVTVAQPVLTLGGPEGSHTVPFPPADPAGGR
jgi:hypothetical protein